MIPEDPVSIINQDGDVWLLPDFLRPSRGEALMACLQRDVAWTQPVITLFGRRVPSPRMAAWYGDPGAVYRYSGLDNYPLPWLPPLADLRAELESATGARYNSALLNLYRDGGDAMGWHSDDEKSLGDMPCIASVSLGAARRFRLRHRYRKDIPPVTLDLPHGSLLVMKGATQTYWKHAVMRTRKPAAPRINLTYRYVHPSSPSHRDETP